MPYLTPFDILPDVFASLCHYFHQLSRYADYRAMLARGVRRHACRAYATAFTPLFDLLFVDATHVAD